MLTIIVSFAIWMAGLLALRGIAKIRRNATPQQKQSFVEFWFIMWSAVLFGILICGHQFAHLW
jgi:peptidoglycan biosynthesis protein MviN/MurJ (putative lipid II flippase)